MPLLPKTGPMRLIINATNLQSGGALQVAAELLQEWNAAFREHEYHVFLSPQLAAVLQSRNFPAHFRFYIFDANPGNSLWLALTFHRKLAALEAQIKPELVFTIFGPALWRPLARHVCGFANGYYLFDRSAFIRNHIRTNLLLRAGYYCRRFLLLRQLHREADVLWVETAAAQLALQQEWKRQPTIKVIGNTYGRDLQPEENREPGHPYRFLCLAAYYRHKNLEILKAVVNILKERKTVCRILVTLPDEVFRRLFPDKETAAYFENAGPVYGAGLSGLYMRADAVLLPSLLETFSAVYPEAFFMGKPVLTSDLNFAKSICGHAALYFDPLSATAIADQMCRLMEDSKLYRVQQENGFERLAAMETPASRAAKLMELMSATVNNK